LVDSASLERTLCEDALLRGVPMFTRIVLGVLDCERERLPSVIAASIGKLLTVSPLSPLLEETVCSVLSLDVVGDVLDIVSHYGSDNLYVTEWPCRNRVVSQFSRSGYAETRMSRYWVRYPKQSRRCCCVVVPLHPRPRPIPPTKLFARKRKDAAMSL